MRPSIALPAPSAAALCQALQASGIVLEALSRTSLSARPRAAVTQEMATAITYHKAALIQLLFGAEPTTPYVCRFCTADFAFAAGKLCRTCAVLVGHPLRCAPESPEESAFLQALATRIDHPEKLCPTVPTMPSTSNRFPENRDNYVRDGHLGTNGHSYKTLPSAS